MIALIMGALLTQMSTYASPATESIWIKTLLRGRSRLVLWRHTAQWYHLEDLPPGVEGGEAVFPTYINGIPWFPEWPEKDDLSTLQDCYSRDRFVGMDPPLPPRDMPVTLGTGGFPCCAEIVQSPSKENNFTLIVEFNHCNGAKDVCYSGDAFWHEIEIEYPRNPDAAKGNKSRTASAG